MSKAIRSKIEYGNISWIESHLDLIRELPEPGIEYRFSELANDEVRVEGVRDDLPESFVHYLQKLKESKTILPQRKIETWGTDYRIYETNSEVWEHVNELHSKTPSLPCGHVHGFKTVDADHGVYRCGYEYCNRMFDRETIEASMQ